LAQEVNKKVTSLLPRYAVPRLSPQAKELFPNYSWPGNIRELANVIERAHVLSTHQQIQFDVIPPEIT
jgi:DNA-binding NtrC family response regulator